MLCSITFVLLCICNGNCVTTEDVPGRFVSVRMALAVELLLLIYRLIVIDNALKFNRRIKFVQFFQK